MVLEGGSSLALVQQRSLNPKPKKGSEEACRELSFEAYLEPILHSQALL